MRVVFRNAQADDDIRTVDTRKRHRSMDLFQTISDAVATVAGELAGSGHDHHRRKGGGGHRGGAWGSFDGGDGGLPGGSVVGSADELIGAAVVDGEIVPSGHPAAAGGSGFAYGRSASVEETWVLAKRVVELKHALHEARQAQKEAILAVEDKCAGLKEQLRLEQERRVRCALLLLLLLSLSFSPVPLPPIIFVWPHSSAIRVFARLMTPAAPNPAPWPPQRRRPRTCGR